MSVELLREAGVPETGTVQSAFAPLTGGAAGLPSVIPLPDGAIQNKIVIDVGVLASLLSQSGDSLSFNLDWFKDPIANLRTIVGGTKRDALLTLLRDLLG